MELDVEENEFSLLDMLVVVAENIKLLVLGPILIGLLALGISFALPQRFTSQAILELQTATPTPMQAAAIMVSPLVLDPVIKSLNLSRGEPIQEARIRLAKQINASVGKDGLLRLEVTFSTPTEAQTIANAIIDTWLKTTLPGERQRSDLEQRLAYAKSALKSVRGLMDRLTTETSLNLEKPLTRGESGVSIVAVGELQARYFAEVLNIPRLLQGLSRDVVIQPPTLPTEPASTKKGLIAIFAALGGVVVILMWVFMRRAWENTAQEPDLAEKQARLLAAVGLKTRAR